MFGIYGIFGDESKLEPDVRRNAFSKMSSDIDGNDFGNQVIHGRRFSIGITKRKIGENKDIALRKVNEDLVMAFCGYGKFRDEKKIRWAGEMIDRTALRYPEEGSSVLKKLEGSFLFLAIHKNAIHIASDRFASKNLFYYDSNRCLIFASDVGRILSAGLTSKRRNTEAAIQVLTAGFFLDSSTLAKDVFRMPPGSIIEKSGTNSNALSMEKYWHFPPREGKKDVLDSNCIDEFHSLVEQSVFELADLEENFIIPLSGGLDSRTIACFLSRRYPLTTLTYDTKEEATIAEQVCRALSAEFNYFSNHELKSQCFMEHIYKSILHQKVHAVINQYFYEPLFKGFFSENRNKSAIFDGVYLDVLFSGPYVFQKFDFEDFRRTYGGGAVGLIEQYSNLSKDFMLNVLHDVYTNLLEEFGQGDDIGKSQFFYSNGRLRRYVLESGNDRLNFCYVFSPGFNYDLADFGYGLSLRLRRGLLYKEMMIQHFPEIMKIRFKDSYGIRKATLFEIFKKKYVNSRLKLSYASSGRIKYFPYQFEYYFLKENHLDDYRDIFMNESLIQEMFSSSQLKRLFEIVKTKQYMINLFQRVLFIHQFYKRNEFLY